MGLLGFFKRSAKPQPVKPAIELLGPTYLEGFFKPDAENTNTTGVWQAELVTPSGNTKFKIKYYGRLHEIDKNLIVDTTSGKMIFEIYIMTTNSLDYEDDVAAEVDAQGLIELPNGQKTEFALVKRNGYDSLFITATNEDGAATEIVSEELA